MILSTGGIGRKLNASVSRIEYVIRARRIRGVCRIGNAWGYDEVGVKRISDELKNINSSKQKGRRQRAIKGNRHER